MKNGSRSFLSPLLGIAALAITLRLVLNAHCYGTNDAANWERFSRSAGLCLLYLRDPYFNNPPLAGYWGQAANGIGAWLGMPFPQIFRLPGIFLDGLTTLLIGFAAGRLHPGKRAINGILPAFVFALSPVSILVSGYHGNTDAVCIFFAVAAVYLLELGAVPVVAGIALALAVSVKLIPVLLLLPLTVSISGWRGKASFLAGFSCAALPYIAAAGCLSAAWQKVFQYESLPEPWGVLGILDLAKGSFPDLAGFAGSMHSVFRSWGRWILIASILGISALVCKTGRPSTPSIAAAVFILFLLLAPGFGVQYAAYPVPFLCALAPLFGFVYAMCSGLFILLVYIHFGFGTSDPLGSFHTGPIPLELAPIGLLSWCVLLLALPRVVRNINAAKTP